MREMKSTRCSAPGFYEVLVPTLVGDRDGRLQCRFQVNGDNLHSG